MASSESDTERMHVTVDYDPDETSAEAIIQYFREMTHNVDHCTVREADSE